MNTSLEVHLYHNSGCATEHCLSDMGWASSDMRPNLGSPIYFNDASGPPEKVVHIHKPAAGLRAIVVVDNVARGPSIGGARMAPDVSLAECLRLARAMTLKNAAAGLAHGGGKCLVSYG